MSNPCSGIPRFTHTGVNVDRYFCLTCQCVVFVPHGNNPPIEHERGINILPDDEFLMPIIVKPGIKGPLPIHELSKPLPGDLIGFSGRDKP